MAETPAVKRMAVVLFDGFTVLDVYGPVQSFGACRIVQPDGTPRRFFQIFAVADRTDRSRAGKSASRMPTTRSRTRPLREFRAAEERGTVVAVTLTHQLASASMGPGSRS